jgi:hypothetical protein
MPSTFKDLAVEFDKWWSRSGDAGGRDARYIKFLYDLAPFFERHSSNRFDILTGNLVKRSAMEVFGQLDYSTNGNIQVTIKTFDKVFEMYRRYTSKVNWDNGM